MLRKFMQESAVFAAIRGNYPKYIITLDDIFVSERNGIQLVEVAGRQTRQSLVQISSAT